MRSEPKILAFDSSAAHCAAALLCGDRLLAGRREEMTRGQAERLMPLLEQVLEEGGAAISDLSAIAVGIGPGNFTGIRIAVSAARGLALSLGIPAIGVSTFDALEFGASAPRLVSVDARRDRCYLRGPDRMHPQQVTPEDLPDALVGSGLDVIGYRAEDLAARTGGTALQPHYPMAEAIARFARRVDWQDAPRPAPLYLRPADAAPPSDPPPVILP